MAKQTELFDKPKQPRIFRAHACDAGESCNRYACRRCGWDSGWPHYETQRTANNMARQGVPCPVCQIAKLNRLLLRKQEIADARSDRKARIDAE
jgi:hypothetical protein